MTPPTYDLEPTAHGECYGSDASIVTYVDWFSERWFVMVGNGHSYSFFTSAIPGRWEGFESEGVALRHIASVGYKVGKNRSNDPASNLLETPEDYLVK